MSVPEIWLKNGLTSQTRNEFYTTNQKLASYYHSKVNLTDRKPASYPKPKTKLDPKTELDSKTRNHAHIPGQGPASYPEQKTNFINPKETSFIIEIEILFHSPDQESASYHGPVSNLELLTDPWVIWYLSEEEKIHCFCLVAEYIDQCKGVSVPLTWNQQLLPIHLPPQYWTQRLPS